VWCVWRFGNLHVKSKLLSVLAFLLRYRDESAFPQFKNSATTLSQAGNGIYQQISLFQLWEQIYPTRHDLNSNSWELLGVYLHLADELSEANWALFAPSRLRKVHGSVRTEEQDSVGNSTYTRHNMRPPCCKGDGCKLQQLVAGLCYIFNLVQGPKCVVSTVVCTSLCPESLTPTLILCLAPWTHYLITAAFFMALIIYVHMSTPWCLPVMFSSSPLFNIAHFEGLLNTAWPCPHLHPLNSPLFSHLLSLNQEGLMLLGVWFQFPDSYH
jgi:hypothetical protein